MRVAVVGATGNVGTALLEGFQQGGADVQLVGVARRVPDTGVPAYNGVEWRAIDISARLAEQRLIEAFEGCDAVVHLAWLLQPNHDEQVMERTNIAGTRAVLAAAADAKVPHVVAASSVGAYSPGPKDEPVSESWRARGIPSSHYPRMKGEQEAILDAFEAEHPDISVARLRPGLIFQDAAGSEIGRYFVGPLIPKKLFKVLPLLPVPREFVFQVVHAADAADAYWRVVQRRATGAFNIAADPVVTPERLAGVLRARFVPIPIGLMRGIVHALWRVRILAADPGWVDMAASVPVMDTRRARRELDWEPRWSSTEAIRAVIDGMAAGDGVTGSPPLAPR